MRKLTVVIPVYNREKIVGRTLESILAQGSLPDELILVDNNSTDSTLSELERWRDSLPQGLPMKVKVLSEREPGAAPARQRGLDAVATEIVMFFDSDDTMRPGHIERARSMFAADESLVIAAWPALIHGVGGSERQPPVIGSPLEAHLLHTMLSTQRYAVLTDYLRGCGGWRGLHPVWDDYELGLRLLLGNPRLAYDPRVMVDVWEQGEGSITGTDFSHKEGAWERVLDKMERMLADADNPHGLRLLAYERVILAAHYRAEGNKRGATRELRRAMDCPRLNPGQKCYIRLAYEVTRRGIRGAARPARFIL